MANSIVDYGMITSQASKIQCVVDGQQTDVQTALNNIQQKYSTDETVVGKWIDGKPIYRKVFMSTFPNQDTDSFIPIGVSYESFTDIFGLVVNSTANQQFVLPYSLPNQGAVILVQGDNFRLRNVGIPWVNLPVLIVAEYTKTTD